MAVLSALQVFMGFGGSFRHILLSGSSTWPNAADLVACWPLSELGSSNPIKNIVRNNAHGIVVGGGFSRGTRMSIAEGALGMTSDGSGGYIRVLHDSVALGPGLSLSFTGTALRVVFMFRSTTNDATLRCIVCKQDTDAAGNGWHIGYQNRKIEFYLKVSGVVVFSLQSTHSFGDGDDHIVICDYDLATASITVDGTAEGSTAATTAPAATTADLRMFLFADGAGPFIGTLSYITLTVSDPPTPSVLNLAALFTEVSSTGKDILSGAGLTLDYGIQGTAPDAIVASVGTAQFSLLNMTPGGAVGYYSPGHANVRSGFTPGVPVLVRMTFDGRIYDWRGVVKQVQPEPGQYRSRRVEVTCVDWMDRLANTSITGVPTQIGQATFELVGRVVDETDLPPCATTFAQPNEIYPYAFDSSQSDKQPAMTELQRLMVSGFGKAFLARDEPGTDLYGGGRLTYYDRTFSQGLSVSAQFDNTMHGLDIAYDRDLIINRAVVEYVPREIGVSAVVLFAIANPIKIAAGATITHEGNYFDPAQRGLKVGGMDFETFTAGTDYAGFVNSDGTGAALSLTASADVGENPGANRVRFTVTNESSTAGYITTLQVRGIAIYSHNPETVIYEDSASMREFGRREVSVSLPYQVDPDVAAEAARWIVLTRRSTLAIATSLSFLASASDALMTQALEREVGDLIEIREAVTSGSVYIKYYIQRVRLTVEKGLVVRCAWALVPQVATGSFFIVDESDINGTDLIAWG